MDETSFATSLRAWAAGDAAAGDRLFAEAYGELKQIAHRVLGSQGRGDQLQTTVLVNECYMKLVGAGVVEASTRQHFMALCARAMRQIVVDAARRQLADKRGGKAARALTLDNLDLDSGAGADVLPPEAVAALDQALSDLDRREPRLARIAECRIFSGMECEEIAQVLGVTARTVQREWMRVKALLVLALEER
jgi:RNA polymerase sigma factor (TIGR02999 family)